MSKENQNFSRGINCQVNLGLIWMIGWLFSIGFIKLSFWKALLAIPLWPYFLGVALR